MSEENNKTINKEEVKFFQKYLHFSQLLDPDIETIALAENKHRINIYFKEPKILCFSFELEVNKEKKIGIYRNVKLVGENGTPVRKFYLLEQFFTIPIRYDFRTIKIQNFPITETDMNGYLDDFNKSYQKRVVPQKEKFSKDDSLLQSGVYQITIVSRNHYIPQGYLRKFECEKKTGYIYNFILDEDKLDESSGNKPLKIENILYLTHFYSLGMELILKNIEDDFYLIREKIILDNNIKRISNEEKVSIVRYIFAQYIRTPLERNRFVNISRLMLESIYFDRDEMGIQFGKLFIRNIVETDMFKFLFPNPEEIRNLELINFYLKNKWKLLLSEHMNFYTSDNPIILYNNSYKLTVDHDYIESLKKPNIKILETRRPHGLMESGIQLYFPITPKLCLLIYNPQNRQSLLNPVEINEQILIQCYQNVLSSNNKIRNFLERKLIQKRNEREKFVKLHLNVEIKEY